MLEQTPAIIIMCKAPVAGTVKTRLVPFLSPEQAAGLSGSFAQDAVMKLYYPNSYIAKFVAFAPSDGKAALKRILPTNLSWIEQQGNDLGERMQNALVSVFKNQVYSPLVVIGTDSPTMPPEYIYQAFTALSENIADVVLGEAADGGFYLIGVNAPDSRIFANVQWSSPRTFEQTANNIKNLNLRLYVLPIWYDVDTPEDLRRLREDILNGDSAANIASNTAEWLRQNENLFYAPAKVS
jgi:rSAM/selenodomain-associated transferase 1